MCVENVMNNNTEKNIHGEEYKQKRQSFNMKQREMNIKLKLKTSKIW